MYTLLYKTLPLIDLSRTSLRSQEIKKQFSLIKFSPSSLEKKGKKILFLFSLTNRGRVLYMEANIFILFF